MLSSEGTNFISNALTEKTTAILNCDQFTLYWNTQREKMLLRLSAILLSGLLTCSVVSAAEQSYYYGWALSKSSDHTNGVFRLEGHPEWKCVKAGDKHPRIRLLCSRVGGLIFHTFEIVSLPKKGAFISRGKMAVKSVLYQGKLNCSAKSSYFTELHLYSGEFLSGKVVSASHKRRTAYPNKGSIMFYIFKDACE